MTLALAVWCLLSQAIYGYQQVEARQAKNKHKLQQAKAALEALDRQASFAAVAREWRQ
jgi:hypothetical protein